MTLQDHIHISLSPATIEDAANIWKITDRNDVPIVNLTVRRGLNSRLRVYAAGENGVPYQLRNRRYTIKVDESNGQTAHERLDYLVTHLGRQVYVCDIYHDPLTHANRRMVLSNIGDISPIGPAMQYHLVDIELEDDTLT